MQFEKLLQRLHFISLLNSPWLQPSIAHDHGGPVGFLLLVDMKLGTIAVLEVILQQRQIGILCSYSTLVWLN